MKDNHSCNKNEGSVSKKKKKKRERKKKEERIEVA